MSAPDPAPSRLELLEQALANLRQELSSQASAAEQEQLQLEEALRQLLSDHQQIETALRDMERQSMVASREAEARSQELREREFELVQLRNQLAERERDLEGLERRHKTDQPALVPNAARRGERLTMGLGLALVAALAALAGVLLSRPAQSPEQPVAPQPTYGRP